MYTIRYINFTVGAPMRCTVNFRTTIHP